MATESPPSQHQLVFAPCQFVRLICVKLLRKDPIFSEMLLIQVFNCVKSPLFIYDFIQILPKQIYSEKQENNRCKLEF